MKEAGQTRDEPRRRPSFSRRELHTRHIARRRIIRRRRIALGTVVAAIVLLTLLAVFALGGSGSSAHLRSSAKRSPRAAVAGRSLRKSPPSLLAQERETNRHILSYTSYISQGSPRRPEIALTFDDGPGPYTPQILSVLERFHVKRFVQALGQDRPRLPG